MIHFTSDTHFGHKNIIKYCNRPFSSVEEMDSTLINNWNSVVKSDDLVYHLGDFAPFHKNPVIYKNQLNGNIILIKGNHDSQEQNLHTIFNIIKDIISIQLYDSSIVMCHYPNPRHPDTSKKLKILRESGSLFLFGHCHGTFKLQNCIDVGVDSHNFFPITLEKILSI